MNAKIPFLWAPNRGCKHTHIYFMNLLICLRDTELFLLYQMVIIYSPVQIHQEYPTFTYFIQEWVFYKGACKYYISRFSQILDPPPKKNAYIASENHSDSNFSIRFPQVGSERSSMCKTSLQEFSHLFTLRRSCSTHHRGLIRFRISDRKFVNQTTEMTIWSMILILWGTKIIYNFM